jgi:hypothetical protein
MRSAPVPTPSVVIASKQPAAQLGACVDSLSSQCRALGAELVVARDPGAGPVDLGSIGVPVTVVTGPSGASIPVLRGLGLAASTGDPVALTEDHLLAAPDWLPQLIGALTPDWDVVGGGMVNAATGRLTDWAAYFSDYGFYSAARPNPPGGPPLLTAANIAYRRAVVADVARWAQEGAWENVVHDRLTAAGRRLRFVPTAQVRHLHHYRFGAFWRNRYQHGRDYARSRLEESPAARAGFRAVTAPALLPTLFWRIGVAAWREAPGAFLLASPLTAAFIGGWVVGEMAGYVGGLPRRDRMLR